MNDKLKILIVCGVVDSPGDREAADKILKILKKNDRIEGSDDVMDQDIYMMGLRNFQVKESRRFIPETKYYNGSFGKNSDDHIVGALTRKGPFHIILFNHCPFYGNNNVLFADLDYSIDILKRWLAPGAYLIIKPGIKPKYNNTTNLLENNGFIFGERFSDGTELNVSAAIMSFMTLVHLDPSLNVFQNITPPVDQEPIKPSPIYNLNPDLSFTNPSTVSLIQSSHYKYKMRDAYPRQSNPYMTLVEQQYKNYIPQSNLLNLDEHNFVWNFLSRDFLETGSIIHVSILFKMTEIINMAVNLLRPEIVNDLGAMPSLPGYMNSYILDNNNRKYSNTIKSNHKVNKYAIKVTFKSKNSQCGSSMEILSIYTRRGPYDNYSKTVLIILRSRIVIERLIDADIVFRDLEIVSTNHRMLETVLKFRDDVLVNAFRISRLIYFAFIIYHFELSGGLLQSGILKEQDEFIHETVSSTSF
tara:strand:+ start:29690 stop:31105 length:1416 start_codon:yes stop_codon:yes gene_type:complete